MFIVTWAKNNPWLAGGAAIIVFIIAYMIFGGGGSTQSISQGASDPNAAMQATQSEQIQASLAANAMGVSAQRDIAMGEQATQLGLAMIAKDIAAGEYAVRTSEINATQQTVALQSTLAARVSEAALAADVQKLNLATAGSVETTRITTKALVDMAKQQSKTSQAAIAAQSAAASCTGLKSFFGGC